jgi:hypothetical protein
MFKIYLIKVVREFWVRAWFVWVMKLNIAGLPKVQRNSFTKSLHAIFKLLCYEFELILFFFNNENGKFKC